MKESTIMYKILSIIIKFIYYQHLINECKIRKKDIMIQLIYGSKSYINFDLLIPLINIIMSDVLNKISDVFRNYINKVSVGTLLLF